METEEYKGYTITIKQDEDPVNPREEWDNLGTMICFHGRYRLGDKHDLKHEDFKGWSHLKKYIKNKLKGHIILPLYAYEHSGITMNTTGFSCSWDSGQVGFIYITAEKIRQEYSAIRISKKLKERVTGYLVGEVETFDQFLTGDVWGYTVSKEDDENVDDSCWGFFGDKYCLEEAKSVVDWYVKRQKELDKVNAIPLKKLPVYIGHKWEFDTSGERVAERIKEGK